MLPFEIRIQKRIHLPLFNQRQPFFRNELNTFNLIFIIIIMQLAKTNICELIEITIVASITCRLAGFHRKSRIISAICFRPANEIYASASSFGFSTKPIENHGQLPVIGSDGSVSGLPLIRYMHQLTP